MKKMLNKSSILPLAAAVLAVVTAIVYAGAKARENAPAIIILLAAAAVLELVAVAVRKASFLEYLPFVCALAGLAVFIDLAFDEIGDILSKINMDGLSASWIASAVLLVVTVIAAALATVWPAKD
ncbi:hypothetical protein [uncultured Pseudoflavonifractor sp.]|uniref:hypothetical protein n=1 Tax=uncultured Pseudoflavonifractor sp. TaxID=1221379 RepID=UPI0025E06802|nr:hypothetical protein [uncultured Pseudoflavonifractor sp.]